MSYCVLALTAGGAALGRKVISTLKDQGELDVTLYLPDQLLPLAPEARSFQIPLRDLVAVLFSRRQKLVMIMATGIVVRLIAPHLQSKHSDPPVVVLDEKGQFAISLLSGHLGGANDLARDLALRLNLTPVITTATDVCGVPAIDVVARDHNLAIDPPEAVRKVNSALIHGWPVQVFSNLDLNLRPSPGLSVKAWNQFSGEQLFEENTCYVLVTNRLMSGLPTRTLFLRPRNLVAGLGCRQNIATELVQEALKLALDRCGKSQLSLRALATADLRGNEPALLANATRLGIPLQVYSRAAIGELYELYPAELQFSEFVKDKIGVGGVCEPAALLAGRQAKLIMKKMKHRGVTVALAEDASGSWAQDPAQ